FSWTGPTRFVIVGTAVVLGSLAVALWQVRTLPNQCDECDRYGRHLFGLTFLLLLIGLCSAVGTSTLAWSGGLGFSASALIEAGDPKHILEAEQKQQDAYAASQAAEKAVFGAEQAFRKAEDREMRACAQPPREGEPISSSCEVARMEVHR